MKDKIDRTYEDILKLATSVTTRLNKTVKNLLTDLKIDKIPLLEEKINNMEILTSNLGTELNAVSEKADTANTTANRALSDASTVNSMVGNLQDEHNTEAITISENGSYPSFMKNLYAYKVGKIVFVSGQAYASAKNTTFTAVAGGLPKALKEVRTVGLAKEAFDAPTDFCGVVVTASGKVNVLIPKASTNYYFSFCYLTNE